MLSSLFLFLLNSLECFPIACVFLQETQNAVLLYFSVKAPHGSDPCKIGGKTDCPTRVPSITSNIGTVFPAGPLETSRAFNWVSSFSLLSFQSFPPPPSTGASFGPQGGIPRAPPRKLGQGWGWGGPALVPTLLLAGQHPSRASQACPPEVACSHH